ncbi:MAG TPA: glycogen synthase GlgA [Deltaproteobacteria bacterium]|nr:MAG: starch synthase [Deltaproteobacteria bacterium GWA2_55_82]OGQ64955.1 MAG: starch synthase [Deltaproteobacteria bacterium RIFCSPLOWO2_02_FULL_55_12]OIJ73865.1 MAG: starch synthase [Deltaproteobacteria bacterium GWC2_55_46]HBG46317.1 glycogen synthase GlgA [Deltaproteobacteria bacterium]HCY09853.1 glycogen synthase GlgA [Deltaproteobacteria bacterium]
MALNVVIAAPEAAPFAKTGGLADVSGSLPAALKQMGCEVHLFMPYYREIAGKHLEVEKTLEVPVNMGRRIINAEVLLADHQGVSVHFIKRDEFFDRSYLYGTPEGDYFDNLERYAFFSRAVLEVIKALDLKPDIIHCNDWQTGLIPAYLNDIYRGDPAFSKTATVFTVHNIAYQGQFPANLYDITGLGYYMLNPEGLEFWGNLSLLKAGIVFSEAITTVSKGYSLEIQTPEYGYGLEGVLSKRKDDLFGILNGVDYTEWDPATDTAIPENYSTEDLKGKSACRKKLLKDFGLKVKARTPLIGMITRLADQKGIDILAEAMPELMKMDLALVILGSGDRRYQDLLAGLARSYPEKLSVKVAFNGHLSHLVEAGADIFLMPSRYEPCGLNQIYSLKYGTVPVVRATGGLDDTVTDYSEGNGTGFKFKEYSAPALVQKVAEALKLFGNKKAWKGLQEKGMKENFSWDDAASRYIEVYMAAKARLHKS